MRWSLNSKPHSLKMVVKITFLRVYVFCSFLAKKAQKWSNSKVNLNEKLRWCSLIHCQSPPKCIPQRIVIYHNADSWKSINDQFIKYLSDHCLLFLTIRAFHGAESNTLKVRFNYSFVCLCRYNLKK